MARSGWRVTGGVDMGGYRRRGGGKRGEGCRRVGNCEVGSELMGRCVGGEGEEHTERRKMEWNKRGRRLGVMNEDGNWGRKLRVGSKELRKEEGGRRGGLQESKWIRGDRGREGGCRTRWEVGRMCGRGVRVREPKVWECRRRGNQLLAYIARKLSFAVRNPCRQDFKLNGTCATCQWLVNLGRV